MGRFRFGFLAVVGALVFALSACGGSDDSKFLNLDQAQTEILRLANNVYGTQYDVGRVRCPSEVPLKQDLTFFCTVEIEGQTLRVNLTQTNDKGNVKIDQAQAVLVTQKMEDFVASYLARQGKPAQSADCGDASLIVRTPGKEVTCTVSYADGTTAVATLGVRDTSGNTPLISVKPPA